MNNKIELPDWAQRIIAQALLKVKTEEDKFEQQLALLETAPVGLFEPRFMKVFEELADARIKIRSAAN